MERSCLSAEAVFQRVGAVIVVAVAEGETGGDFYLITVGAAGCDVNWGGELIAAFIIGCVHIHAGDIFVECGSGDNEDVLCCAEGDAHGGIHAGVHVFGAFDAHGHVVFSVTAVV